MGRRRGSRVAKPGDEVTLGGERGVLVAYDQLLASMNTGGIGSVLRLIDSLMPVMDEELRARWPLVRDEPQDIGVVLFPTIPVRSSDPLYRAHVREMLSRIDDAKLVYDRTTGEVSRPTMSLATLKSLSILTRAELLGITSAASLRHPLRHSDVVLMEVLFREVLPDVAARALAPEAHSANLIAEVRRDIAERLVVSPERKKLA